MTVIVCAAWICIFSPLIGAAVTPLLARRSLSAGGGGAVCFSFFSAVSALMLLPVLFEPQTLPIESRVLWLDNPIEIGFGVLIDPLSIVLSNVVAVVSFIIMIYCLGYMKADPARTRFWMWMNGFIGSMLLLVLSNNLFFLFVGWKLVGVCSYGLIGYYYQDQRTYWIGGPSPAKYVTPSQASLKALLVTGIGDMFMLGGILILYFYAGTLNFLELYDTAPVWISHMATSPGMVILTSLLLLAGPVGKSAQFPLHEWLPEAMAGPGPVSALIHAATMVKSGVYLVARLVPLFYVGYWGVGIEAAGWFFHITAWVGAFTALLAATQGMVALEFKKILAYSTVSQIGYMMLALGAAGLAPNLLLEGYTSGIFHLVSHALFKACLFLCAGTVIHAAHSIYIQDMGALRTLLKLTWLFSLIASLSLMGVPPLPGFWSKDAVLLVVLNTNVLLFGLALITVALTAFYTVRCLGMVFHGLPSESLARVVREGTPVNDGTTSMRWAVAVLAILIVLAGIGGPMMETTLHNSFETSLVDELAVNSEAETPAVGESHAVVSALALVFLVAGAFPAYIFYIAHKASSDTWLKGSRPLVALHGFFWDRWLIDSFYQSTFVDGTRKVATLIAHKVENRWDEVVHRRLPLLFTESSQRLLQRLRTDTEELFYNVSYVLVLFVLLLTFLLLNPS